MKPTVSVTEKMAMTRRRMGEFVAVGLAAGLLGGCTSVLVDNEPQLYRLTPANAFAASLPRVGWQLEVDTPAAAAGIDTGRIALRDTPTNLDYFAGVSWTDRAPQMVQGLLVESFENSSRIVAVGRDTAGLRPDYVLKTELRDFQAEYPSDRARPPRLHIRLSAKLVAMPRRTIEASESFEATVDAPSTRFGDIIAAWDQAMNQVLRQTVEWTLTRPVSSSGRVAS